MKTALLRTMPRALRTVGMGLVAASIAGTPAAAAPKSGSYSVVLEAPLAETRREIIGGTVWRCQADRCSAPADGERLLSVCSSVARKFGAVASFTAPQGAMSAEDLSRCNKR
jgi:hypothetical protein